MSEFTKGTWKVSGRYVIAKQNEEDFIRICLNLSSDVDAELIASAPTLKQQRDDLLEACKIGRNRLLELGQRKSMDTVKILKDAIAKCKP